MHSRTATETGAMPRQLPTEYQALHSTIITESYTDFSRFRISVESSPTDKILHRRRYNFSGTEAVQYQVDATLSEIVCSARSICWPQSRRR